MKALAVVIMFIAPLQIKSDMLVVIVANDRENILYVGVENPVSALIEKNTKDVVFLRTNNGIIDTHEVGRFSIIPQKKGVAIITVCKITKKDTIAIGNIPFRVKSLPDPVARIANQKKAA
jgi:hypothetical protein